MLGFRTTHLDEIFRIPRTWKTRDHRDLMERRAPGITSNLFLPSQRIGFVRKIHYQFSSPGVRVRPMAVAWERFFIVSMELSTKSTLDNGWPRDYFAL